MSNLKRIFRRIKTAQNISKITRAMEMVAASKMRRAQDRALSSRPYTDRLYQILASLEGRVDPQLHPLLQDKSQGKTMVILLTTDKGLCGPHNTNLFRSLETWITTKPNLDFNFVAVGKKGAFYVVKTNRQLIADFPAFPDRFAYEDTLTIAQMVLDGFLKGDTKEVWLGYMRFINILSHQPHFTKLLPITQLFDQPQTPPLSPEATGEYLFEPSTQDILNWLLPYYVELQIYQAVLNALASEHSARMVAMKSAHDNATDIISDLTLDYNRARQGKITSELLDIITARTALGE
ncbi:MAG: ATP synthase F1 subunit gamma [Candidatus Chisholmbacteria bacterium]|nr:ATP synthase F1 subunit gamma [Candidatus Chisholmbacteria bacterium]